MAIEEVPLRQVNTNQVFTFTYSGNLNIEATQMRLYNDTEETRFIKYIRASVGTPSTGAAIVVNILNNGTSIFSPGYPTTAGAGAKPRILITEQTHTKMSEPLNQLWEPEDYLTVSIDQIGSSFAGADLTINVVVSE